MASTDKLNLIDEVLTDSATGEAKTLEPRSTDFIAHIVATSVNAATTVAAKVQHSPDKTNWYDLVSFTNIVGADGAEPQAVTGPVFQHVRGAVTLSGATKAATVSMDLHFDQK